MKIRKNQALFSPALAFVLCLLFCAAIPLPLSAAGIQGTDASDSGRGSQPSGTAAAVPQADRVTYQEGFFYESLSEEIKARITGISYGEGCIVPYEDLRYLHVLYISGPHLSKIVGNISGGALVTAICILLYSAGIGNHLNFMVIGSIMPLIPGVPFTNSIRDIADGDYISGSVRMLDALLVFFCIAIGVGVGFALAGWMTGGALL